VLRRGRRRLHQAAAAADCSPENQRNVIGSRHGRALLGALLLGVVLAPSACQRPPAEDASCTVRFPVPPPSGMQFAPRERPAVSPDGSSLAVVVTDPDGKRRLWIRSLGGPAAEPIAGTD